MFGRKPSLDRIRKRATRAIIAHARSITPGAWGFSFGAIDIDPKHLSVWVATKTDAQRDRLASNPAVSDRFRQILAAEGYPASVLDEVNFTFESQETVDREFGGNWWYAQK